MCSVYIYIKSLTGQYGLLINRVYRYICESLGVGNQETKMLIKPCQAIQHTLEPEVISEASSNARESQQVNMVSYLHAFALG